VNESSCRRLRDGETTVGGRRDDLTHTTRSTFAVRCDGDETPPTGRRRRDNVLVNGTCDKRTDGTDYGLFLQRDQPSSTTKESDDNLSRCSCAWM